MIDPYMYRNVINKDKVKYDVNTAMRSFDGGFGEMSTVYILELFVHLMKYDLE